MAKTNKLHTDKAIFKSLFIKEMVDSMKFNGESSKSNYNTIITQIADKDAQKGVKRNLHFRCLDDKPFALWMGYIKGAFFVRLLEKRFDNRAKNALRNAMQQYLYESERYAKLKDVCSEVLAEFEKYRNENGKLPMPDPYKAHIRTPDNNRPF